MTKRYRCPECNKPVVDPVFINKENCGHILCLKCGERNALTWKPCPVCGATIQRFDLVRMTEEELEKYDKKSSSDKSEKPKSDEAKSVVKNSDEKKFETIKSDQTKSEAIKSDEKILAEPDQKILAKPDKNFQTLEDEFETLCDETQNIEINEENTVQNMVQNLQELSPVSDVIEKKILCKFKK